MIAPSIYIHAYWVVRYFTKKIGTKEGVYTPSDALVEYPFQSLIVSRDQAGLVTCYLEIPQEIPQEQQIPVSGPGTRG